MMLHVYHYQKETAPSLPGYPCVISHCGLYRYALYRVWSNYAKPRLVMFLMLNPSTADADQLDPTLKRCKSFSQDWNYDGFCICNLFAFRATDPDDMRRADDPVGDDCDLWMLRCLDHCEIVVAAWGVNGNYQKRDKAMLAMFRSLGRELHALQFTKDGHPQHPLFVPARATAQIWNIE